MGTPKKSNSQKRKRSNSPKEKSKSAKVNEKASAEVEERKSVKVNCPCKTGKNAEVKVLLSCDDDSVTPTTSVPLNPSMRSMVNDAFLSLNKRFGLTAQQVSDYAFLNYQANAKAVFKSHVQKYLNAGVKDGSLVCNSSSVGYKYKQNPATKTDNTQKASTASKKTVPSDNVASSSTKKKVSPKRKTAATSRNKASTSAKKKSPKKKASPKKKSPKKGAGRKSSK